ncbi:MAG: hypothetical protein VYE22_21420 [Myxococcota bacterium]|nr:hypothetical protein [Myxococcota bacterium]
MNERRRCQNRTLARGPVLQVEQCADCGALSLHLGGLTLRVQADAAESAWATLGEALHQLHESSLETVRPIGHA